MRRLMLILFAASGLLSLNQAIAQPAGAPKCIYALPGAIFNSQSLTSALALYNIDQNLWYPISAQLQLASAQAPAAIQAYAQQMFPNPLEPVYYPDGAAQLLYQVTYAQFYQALQGYRVSYGNNTINDAVIQGAFNYLWTQQLPIVQRCMVSPGVAPGWEGYR